MARIARVGDDVTVHLGVWEKIAGLHGDLRFPASAITAVEVDHDPLSSVRGMRAVHGVLACCLRAALVEGWGSWQVGGSGRDAHQ